MTEENRPPVGSVLAGLWDAYDGDLREQGVSMPYFRAWREAVKDGEESCPVEGALAALENGMRLIRARQDFHSMRLLERWIERLATAEEARAGVWNWVWGGGRR